MLGNYIGELEVAHHKGAFQYVRSLEAIYKIVYAAVSQVSFYIQSQSAEHHLAGLLASGTSFAPWFHFGALLGSGLMNKKSNA